MLLHLDPDCSTFVGGVLARADGIRLTDSPEAARLIVFDKDEPRRLRRSPLWRRFPEKCVVISEGDRPSFMLPGLYSSNDRRLGALVATETMHYPGSGWRNPWIGRYEFEPFEKTYLYSLMGKSSNFVRRRIFRLHHRRAWERADVLIEPTDPGLVGPVGYREDLEQRYAEVLARSRFALCPRGFGTGSVRLFEVCQMGVAPVILADRWPPIGGVDWSFALFVRQADFARLDAIIRSVASEAADRGRAARKAYDDHFSPEATPRMLSNALARLESRMGDAREAAALRRGRPAYAAARWLYEQAIEARNTMVETLEVCWHDWDVPRRPREP